jgi:hypothetical protein
MGTADPGHVAVLLTIGALFACLYFIPAIVAFCRKKTNRAAILAVNIFLGWTFLGWVVALVWALAVDVVDQPR